MLAVTVQRSLTNLNETQSLIDILANNLLTEAETSKCLRKTNNTEQSTGADVGKLSLLGLIDLLSLAHGHISTNHVIRNIGRHNRTVAARLGNILTDLVGSEQHPSFFTFRVLVVHVDVGDVLGQLLVALAGGSIQKQEHDIETREQSGG